MVIVSAALPPALDGIGDYTAHLAAELTVASGVADVCVVCGNSRSATTPIDGVRILQAFDPRQPKTATDLLSAIATERPDWVVLQYNPFSYGRRGFNLHLPRVLRRLHTTSPGTRLALMCHETYVPVINWKFAVMTTWQRWQLWQLGRAADVVMFSIQPWAERHRRWFPGKPIHHLPVGSNVPRVSIEAAAARDRLGIAADEIVLGVFGQAHISRSFSAVAAAAARLTAAGYRPRVLYVGPDGDRVRRAIGPQVPTIADGPLPPDEVSRRLAAIDLAISSYSDGVSTRRGAMMAALQHGLAVVGTRGIHTDPELLSADGHALTLVPAGDDAALADAVVDLVTRPQHRATLAEEGRRLFERRFSWPRITERMLTYLAAAPARN